LRSSLLCFLGILGSLDLFAVHLLLDSGLSQFLVSVELLHISSKGLDLASLGDLFDTEDSIGGVLNGTSQLVSGGIVDLSLLWLVANSWEQDQFVLVLGQSLNVGGHGVGVLVVSSVVNSNSDSSSEVLSQTNRLELIEREPSSELNLVAVLLGLSEDNWSQLADGGNSERGSLGSSSLLSQLLVSWLIKEAFDSSLPVLSQVGTLNDIIVFYHVAY